MEDATSPNCQICGGATRVVSSHAASLHGFIYSLRRCGICGFISKRNDVSLDEIYHSVYDENDFIGDRLRNWDGRSPERSYVEPFLRLTSERPACLLEVGPGAGRNLLFARQAGFTPATLDVSAANNSYYRESFGFEEVYDDLQAVPNGRFHAILMTHVIEHIPNPVDFVRNMGNKLRPGGFLLISTPNSSSFFGKLFGYQWWVYAIDDHVSFFNHRNLTELLRKGSFTVSEISTPGINATHSISQFLARGGRTRRSLHAQSPVVTGSHRL